MHHNIFINLLLKTCQYLFAFLLIVVPWSNLTGEVHAITQSDALKYINERLWVQNAINSQTSDLQSELDYEVNRLIDLYDAKGRIEEQYFEVGITGSWILYQYPGDQINILTNIYPYLSSATQTRLKTYLNKEIREYDLVTLGSTHCSNGWGACQMTGNRREYFSIPTSPNPDSLSPNVWPVPSIPAESLYTLWNYAETTGDWSFISTTTPASGTRWNNIKAIFNSIPTTPTRYGQVAGAIGYARLLKHFNMQSDASFNTAVTIVQNGLTAGQNFSTFLDNSYTSFLNNSGHDWAFTVFHYNRVQNAVGFHFAPEIGRFLNEYALNDVRTRVTSNPNEGQAGQKNAIESHWPDWFVYRGEYPSITLWTGHYGENHMVTPDTPWALFMIHTYVYNESGDTLRKYLGAPYGVADLAYLDKIAAAITGYSTKVWSSTSPINFSPSPSATPSPTPSPTPTPTPNPCILTSASWGRSSVVQGATVGLNVNVSGSCSGKQVTFEVRRYGSTALDDIPATQQPQTITISGASVLGSWNAERNSLIPGTDPDYYFKATVLGGNTITSADPKLKVTSNASSPTPTSTPTPTASPTASPIPIVGDINNSGRVDIFDLSILLRNWNSSDSSSYLNKDGVVNIFDLSILLRNWSK